jgi:predicted dehydrogenase/threonine dehydrogenase-like Zn-dependent dehydrogenase
MLQIMQDLGSGTTHLVEAPAPLVRSGHILIETTRSLISTGTERMLVDFGKSGLLAKARSQPEKVAQVLSKIKTDGLLTTVDAVRSKLAQPIALGYCNVGRVRAVGDGVTGFKAGDRVVSNGSHADVVLVPQNLCALVPDSVDDETAAFTVVASIGLQGIRLAMPTLGETVVVTGAGLIGLLTVQLLLAQGCRVMAIDFDADKLALAAQFGAATCNPAAGEDPVAMGMAFSRGAGVDAVIITASTKSSDPVTDAARMCRKRGRIILVGVTGLELSRADFYEKELSFQVSCSYGPGRYDPGYEEAGHDYPLGFVRWTEQRNFVAVLDAMAARAVSTETLISHQVPFVEAPRAYALLSSDPKALGILLAYDHTGEGRFIAAVNLPGSAVKTSAASGARIGVIGAGNYASRVLIPAFRKAGATMGSIASAGGVSSVVHGKRLGFAMATADSAAILADPDIDCVAIATRHDSHARLTEAALQAGKHVFVEKPLCLTHEELASLRAVHAQSGRQLMVGYNRRFAPLVKKMKAMIDVVAEPKAIVMVMNAGAIPAGHWTQDPAIGGGRILGEACHHVDLMRHLVGSPIISIHGRRMGANDAQPLTTDKAVLTIGFADGSFGTVHYLANGGAAFPKERIEVFTSGRTLQLDNFVKLVGFNWPGFSKTSLWKQDKGQEACAAAFIRALQQGDPAPIPADELFEVAAACIDVVGQMRDQH